jgi:hypothetical protein
MPTVMTVWFALSCRGCSSLEEATNWRDRKSAGHERRNRMASVMRLEMITDYPGDVWFVRIAY